MKNLLIISVLALFLTSCIAVSTPVLGTLYTDVKAPLAATSNSG
jgi:hypothetical protein